MSTSVGLLTVKPLEFKSPRGEYIVKFTVAYDGYKSSVMKVNDSQRARRKIEPVGYKLVYPLNCYNIWWKVDFFGENRSVKPNGQRCGTVDNYKIEMQ